MIFGEFELAVHNFGNFRLDGGAMFGSVPKNLWSKKIPADSENCIKLATNSLIIKHERRTFLVDLGMGSKWSDKEKAIYAIEERKEAQIVNPANITDIILTHLHFDHAGGISKLDSSGNLTASYPDATIYLQEDNLNNAKSPSSKEKASYLKENVEFIERQKYILTKGTQEIYKNIFVHQVNGHTVGQQIVEIKDGNSSVFFATDLIPTAHHLGLAYQMGYDMCAATVIKEKEDFLNKVLETDSIIVFQHDSDTQAAKIAKDARGNFLISEKISFS